VAVARSSSHVTALTRQRRVPELFTWEMPSWALRRRVVLNGYSKRYRVFASGVTATLGLHGEADIPSVLWERDNCVIGAVPQPSGARTFVSDGGDTLAMSGDGPSGAAQLHVIAVPRLGPWNISVLLLECDPSGISFREHADRITVWDDRGRIVAAEADGSAILANLRTA
jgi:hypothetical protein